MQKLFDAVKARLELHLRQRDDVALAVCTDESEALIVSKLLEGIDDASTSELFWICTDAFTDAHSWVSAAVDAFAVRHGSVALEQRKQGRPEWPPMPDAALDASLPPAYRLREVMTFSRQLLPVEGALSVWCLFPLEVADWRAFATLVWELLDHQFPVPWFHHLRFYLRADPTDGWMYGVSTHMKRVAWYDPDLSPAAMQQAVDEEAMDPAQPMEQRMQNVFLSAQMDYSYGRLGDALHKQAALLRYYGATKNGTMTALVLNAVGEVHQRVGNTAQAGHCFEQAVMPASFEANPPVAVLLNVSLNLGNLRMSEGRYAEAESYYDLAQGYAALQRAPDTRLRSIENLGICQYAQGKLLQAATSWRAAAQVAAQLEMPELQRRLLERLRALYYEVRDSANQMSVERELAALDMAAPPAHA